jgi:hypothetical protein
MAIGVYYQGIFITGQPDIGQVVEMDMSVDKVFRLKNPHKPEEGFKPPMTAIVLVVDALRRRVGKEYVQKTSPENPVNQ